MTKALSLILGLLMLVQVVHPLALPGLRRRTDAWKIAVLALALIMATATLRPGESAPPVDAPLSGAADPIRSGPR